MWAAVERFAHARGAIPGTMLWNFAQGSVVPGPSELLFVPLAIADPPRAKYLALAAWTGSMFGGCVAYLLGALAFEPVARPLLGFLGIGDASIAQVTSLMARYGWLVIMGSTLTPISTKAVMITAGATGLPFPGFIAALAAGRALRYVIILWLLRAGEGPLHRMREKMLAR